MRVCLSALLARVPFDILQPPVRPHAVLGTLMPYVSSCFVTPAIELLAKHADSHGGHVPSPGWFTVLSRRWPAGSCWPAPARCFQGASR